MDLLEACSIANNHTAAKWCMTLLEVRCMKMNVNHKVSPYATLGKVRDDGFCVSVS